MKRGFTLLESLVALTILVIGFSALYYWFLTFATIARHDHDRIFAFRTLRNQAEQLAAYPRDARDSTWFLVSHGDTFWITQAVLDSADRHTLVEDSAWSQIRRNRFLARPDEVTLSIRKEPAEGFVEEHLFLLVGGVNHVYP